MNSKTEEQNWSESVDGLLESDTDSRTEQNTGEEITMNRRDFMKNTAGAAGAVTFPGSGILDGIFGAGEDALDYVWPDIFLTDVEKDQYLSRVSDLEENLVKLREEVEDRSNPMTHLPEGTEDPPFFHTDTGGQTRRWVLSPFHKDNYKTGFKIGKHFALAYDSPQSYTVDGVEQQFWSISGEDDERENVAALFNDAYSGNEFDPDPERFALEMVNRFAEGDLPVPEGLPEDGINIPERSKRIAYKHIEDIAKSKVLVDMRDAEGSDGQVPNYGTQFVEGSRTQLDVTRDMFGNIARDMADLAYGAANLNRNFSEVETEIRNLELQLDSSDLETNWVVDADPCGLFDFDTNCKEYKDNHFVKDDRKAIKEGAGEFKPRRDVEKEDRPEEVGIPTESGVYDGLEGMQIMREDYQGLALAIYLESGLLHDALGQVMENAGRDADFYFGNRDRSSLEASL